MDTLTQSPAPVTQPRRLVPTTQLLHFTLILNVVCGIAAVLIYLIIAASGFAARDDNSAVVASGLIVAVLCGLNTWWWVHCWKTLKNLRGYAEELFWNNK